MVAVVAVVAALAAGCAAPAADRLPAAAVAADATDVWFMQHLVPHLRQTISVADLSSDRITRPELARLAEAARRQSQAHLQLLQGWLDRRGPAPHSHSHQAVDRQPRSDLERLSRVPDARFDRTLRRDAGGPAAGRRPARRHRAPPGQPARGPGARPPAAGRAPPPAPAADGLEGLLVEDAAPPRADLMADDRRRRVLVVEDNEVNQALAVAILARLGYRYRCDVVGDGRQAVELMLGGGYEAVLMDCQLPVLDGYQATAEIRRREGTARRTPIIAMTAAVLQDRQTCLAAGMDDHIAKPVLLSEVEAVLARRLQDGRGEPNGRWIGRPAASTGEVLDQRRLAELGRLDPTGNGPALLGRLLESFLARIPLDLADLRTAFRQGSWPVPSGWRTG
jgi:CheY-like chemotaxis protein